MEQREGITSKETKNKEIQLIDITRKPSKKISSKGNKIVKKIEKIWIDEKNDRMLIFFSDGRKKELTGQISKILDNKKDIFR